MDARAYRLSSLSACKVFELDIKQVLDYKAKKIASVRDLTLPADEAGHVYQTTLVESPAYSRSLLGLNKTHTSQRPTQCHLS